MYPAPLHSVVSLSHLRGRGAGDRVCGIPHTGDFVLGCLHAMLPTEGERGGRIGGDTRVRSASRMPNGELTRASLAAKKGIARGRPGYLGGEGACEPGKERRAYGNTFELKGPVEAKESNAPSIVASPEDKTGVPRISQRQHRQ